ncbi:MAG: MFS transporter [Gaiellaceae bacterium MAG52_C11]|nr:MFS transporter [Candidatus Gaiellasilicea maunaloa]
MPSAARTAVTVVFFASGAAYGSWVARLPSLQAGIDGTKSELGVALFGIPGDSIVMLPVAGWLAARLGSRSVAQSGLVGVAVSLPLIGLAPSLLALTLAFAAFGVASATIDLAMNAHGVSVERRYGRPILSSFHAAFSLGGLAGASAGGAAAALGVSPLAQLSGAAAVILGIGVWSRSRLLPGHVDAAPGQVYGRPSAGLVALAALAFAGLLAEGAAGDWSGIYLNETLGTGEGAAGAFVGFSITMTLGRLVGDRLTSAWGATCLTRGAGLLGAAGIAAALLSRDPLVAVVGFVCLGAGLSTVIPTVFRAAAAAGPSPGAGIAAVSTVGYGAFLVGPPAIGVLADATSLTLALSLLVGLCALITLLAGATAPAGAVDDLPQRRNR